jgi:methyl-accepting chemotaxis protein
MPTVTNRDAVPFRALAALGGAISTSLRRLLLIDLAVTVAHGGLWVMLNLVTPTVAVVTSLLRMAVWLAYANHSLGPVRDWLRHGDSDGRRLFDAYATLENFGRRVGLAHLIGWAIGDALWLALAFLGIPVELPVGRAELLSATMLASSLLLAPLLIEPVMDNSLSDLHTEVRGKLVEQRLELDVAAPTMPRVMTRLILATFLATMAGLSGAGLAQRVDSIRAAAMAEQQRLVEVSAIRVDAGLGAPLEGVEIVERDALPARLAAELERQGGPAVLSAHDPRREQVFAAAPTADGRWAISVAHPDEELGLSLGLVVTFIVLFAPVFALAAWAYARSVAQPIQRFAEAMERFASHGELRALARSVPLRGSEIGRLSASFNQMLDILEELAQAAQKVAEGDLSVDLEREGELQDAFRGMLARLNQIVGRVRETSLEVASAAAEIQALTQQQQAAAQQQSSGVQQVSATVASLADAAQRIASVAQGVLDNAEQAVSTTDAMTDKIAALRGHAATVSALLEVIRDVADRSDLLALNGSLEATRAGEAGRGFALVAAEMRRLAERVTQTVGDVRAQVTDIESSGTNTVMATEQSRKLAQLTATAARQIWTVTGQQSADTNAAALGVHELAEVIVASTIAVSQTHAAAEGLRMHAAELERLLATFRTAN